MDNTQKIEKVVKTKKTQKRDYIYAVGRQKEAVARVRLYTTLKEGIKWGENELKKEQILVNQLPVEHYFSGPAFKKQYMLPFELTSTLSKFAVTVQVSGGGKKGQLGAMVQGVARALEKYDTKKYRSLVKTAGLLTRDARVRERRKVGTGGKARRMKQSPKR